MHGLLAFICIHSDHIFIIFIHAVPSRIHIYFIYTIFIIKRFYIAPIIEYELYLPMLQIIQTVLFSDIRAILINCLHHFAKNSPDSIAPVTWVNIFLYVLQGRCHTLQIAILYAVYTSSMFVSKWGNI